ncbi:sodium-dependent neutral amino acid transporter B(0)AT3-like [Varanus komodoensis]|uniref:sodium-dependent neutral amino acid transporter B(0)AT3-like n=1 Tax=Varanus komodoensis TaxID=61221 RepID=UPI001CF770DB|nr:sodium-dependent neutral amino acid transporter B(0)AT3-like [Varanus komodoensis]
MSHAEDSRDIQVDARPKWDNKVQYLLSCIGFAVGFGNVWRFPYLCQIYGGGAFLIPYVIALFFEGIPLFHLELAIGQRLRKGSIGVWTQISPYLGGLGYACMVASFLVSVYYNMILAWVLWYFVNSFRDPLPWSICPEYNYNAELAEECHKSTASTFFWYRHTLNISSDITQSGPFLWWMVLCLAACWIILYMCTIRGIESSGRVIYLTGTFPYILLTVFLVYGLTLPGARAGLIYLFTPNVDVLKNPRTWLDAATQIFYSLSLALGGLIAYSSYNPQKNDCEKDALTIAIVNSLTSLYAAIPIFSILGFKATVAYTDCLNRNIKKLEGSFNLLQQRITKDNYTTWLENLSPPSLGKVAELQLINCDLQHFLDQSTSGTGLAFIVFTEAIVHLPGAQAWAILFFIMLFSLGLSSMFGLVQSILTSFLEFQTVSKYLPKEAVSGIICLISFLLGLIFTLRSGSYWLEVFDSYTGSIPLLIIALFELIGINFVYGMKRFCDDVEWMTGRQPNFYWKASWQVISPVLMLTVFLAYIAVLKPPGYSGWNPNYTHFPEKETKVYPKWVVFICSMLATVPCLFIPAGAIYHLWKVMLKRKEKQALHPSNSTGAN